MSVVSISNPETRPYGRWSSPVSIESIFSQPATPGYPFSHDGVLYYLQALPAEGGRIALMAWREGKAACMTPPGFNIRSAVHEYGGKCFCVVDDAIIFNNFEDGVLYRQPLKIGSRPERVSADQERLIGFADLVSWRDQASGAQWIIGVGEYRRTPDHNLNQILAVRLGDVPGVPVVLQHGADFYAAPRVHGIDFAWVEWQLPGMPWDRAALYRGTLTGSTNGGGIGLQDCHAVVDHAEHSVSQPDFCPDGSLVYACDSPTCDWWDLHVTGSDDDGRLTRLKAEVGTAHWVFGQSRWVAIGDGSRQLVCIATSHEGDRLLLVDRTGVPPRTLLSSGEIGHLWLDNESPGYLLLVAYPVDRPGSILRLHIESGDSVEVGPPSAPLTDEGCSIPEPVAATTRDGETTYGYFYPPFNPRFAASADSRPPLLVTVHGGPTSRTSMSFSPLRQYFASLGFAVLDINHRGSTGYGRQFRQRLLGNWGEIDCTDIADLVQAMCDEGRIDPNAIFIRGGSAGGYAVLRALTRIPELFAGGACYYGIGNLITLSEITHKFEGSYTDSLIGEPFDPAGARLPSSRYVARSPIFEMDQLQAPVILFQGLKDNVVPPDVTREVVALLEEKGIRHDYIEYENEGHGFRSMETRIDALQRETSFFIDIL